jgi:hypothetical protein
VLPSRLILFDLTFSQEKSFIGLNVATPRGNTGRGLLAGSKSEPVLVSLENQYKKSLILPY